MCYNPETGEFECTCQTRKAAEKAEANLRKDVAECCARITGEK